MKYFAVLIIIVLALFSCKGSHLRRARMLNGKKGFAKAFPYMASVEYRGENVCAGTILTRKAILTTAHCFDAALKTVTYKVRVGSVQREKGGIVFDIGKLVKHQSYKSIDKYSYDVAVVFIKGSMTFDRTISSLALPKGTEPLPAGEEGIVSGWGKITQSGARPTVVHYASLTILPRDECEKKFATVKNGVKMFCAGGFRKGTCHGDSGAPFVANGRIYGIVAYGKKFCDPAGSPAVFMDMAFFSKWVAEILKGGQGRMM